LGANSNEINKLRNDKKQNKLTDKEIYSKFIVDLLVTKFIENLKLSLNEIKIKFKLTKKYSFQEKKEKIFNEHKYFDNIGNVRNKLEDLLNYNSNFQNKDNQLRSYLKNIILNSHNVQIMDGRASFIIRQLFKAFISNPQQLSDNTIGVLFEHYIQDKESKKELSNIRKENTNVSEQMKYLPIRYLDSINKRINKRNFGELRNLLQYLHFKYECNIYKRNLVRTICDHIAGMTDKRALEEYQRLYGISHEVKIY
jgi:dGTPase